MKTTELLGMLGTEGTVQMGQRLQKGLGVCVCVWHMIAMAKNRGVKYCEPSARAISGHIFPCGQEAGVCCQESETNAWTPFVITGGTV